MVANFYQVTPEQLAEFLRRPAVAYDYTLTPFFCRTVEEQVAGRQGSSAREA
jgi:hypothetical protein